MDREKILKRAQSQSIGLDEREQQMLGVSFGFGAVLMILVVFALAAAALLRGGQVYDYAAIVFAYLTGAQAHQYWKTRRRAALVSAAACAIVMAANLLLFLGGQYG